MQLLKKTEGSDFIEYESTISIKTFKSVMYGVSAYFILLIIYILMNGDKQVSSMDVFGILLLSVFIVGILVFIGLNIYAYAIYFSLMGKVRKLGGTISIKTTNSEASYAATSNASWIKILVPGIHLRWTKPTNQASDLQVSN